MRSPLNVSVKEDRAKASARKIDVVFFGVDKILTIGRLGPLMLHNV
jgi:hypothetical protein